MQRLSGLDASFLYLETAAQPLHVCSILELDTSTMPGGYTFDRMRDKLGLRSKAMPQFREKLADRRFNPTTRCGSKTRISTSTGICIGSDFHPPAAGSLS